MLEVQNEKPSEKAATSSLGQTPTNMRSIQYEHTTHFI